MRDGGDGRGEQKPQVECRVAKSKGIYQPDDLTSCIGIGNSKVIPHVCKVVLVNTVKRKELVQLFSLKGPVTSLITTCSNPIP